MKKPALLYMALALCLALIPMAGAQNSIDGKYDIAELMQTAQASFDLGNEDAVFLLDNQKTTFQPDGRLATRIHRIIWINSNMAINSYGDHRIPYDKDREEFQVGIVRTWRDNQWWVSGPTGIVETLPEECRHAYDYANRREMMLLHNGIEIPCILEVEYTITDKVAHRTNISGSRTFQREMPTVISSLQLEVPADKQLQTYSPPGLPAPEKENTPDGLTIYSWQVGPLQALPYPHNIESELMAPSVKWSTWESWESLALALEKLYSADSQLDSTVLRDLDSLNGTARDNLELAELTANYISEKNRYVDYNESLWFWQPRGATRIFNSGYAHRLDRALLTKALLAYQGIDCELIFVHEGLIKMDMSIPCLDGKWQSYILLNSDLSQSFYDPSESRIIKGNTELTGRTCFYFEGTHQQRIGPIKAEFPDNNYILRMELSFDKEQGILVGKGYLSATGYLNPYDEMAGLNDEAKSYLDDLMGGLLDSTELKNYNPLVFDCGRIKIGFDFEAKKPKADDQGRISLNLGEPSGGIINKLPGDVHLYNASRDSWIYFPGAMKQDIQIKIDTVGLDLIYFPQNQDLANSQGVFRVETKPEGTAIAINRSLAIINSSVAADQWPLLRALLLAETHEKNHKLIFKIREEEK